MTAAIAKSTPPAIPPAMAAIGMLLPRGSISTVPAVGEPPPANTVAVATWMKSWIPIVKVGPLDLPSDKTEDAMSMDPIPAIGILGCMFSDDAPVSALVSVCVKGKRRGQRTRSTNNAGYARASC